MSTPIRFGSITAIGSFTAINGVEDDYLSCDPQRCVSTPSLRTTVEDKPGADGVMIFPPLEGAQILTISGPIVIRSDGSESGYYDAIDTVVASLAAQLDAMKTATDTVSHSGDTMNCWLYSPLLESWEEVIKIVTFGLIVESVV